MAEAFACPVCGGTDYAYPLCETEACDEEGDGDGGLGLLDGCATGVGGGLPAVEGEGGRGVKRKRTVSSEGEGGRVVKSKSDASGNRER